MTPARSQPQTQEADVSVWRIVAELNGGDCVTEWFAEEDEARVEFADMSAEVGKYPYYSPHHIRCVELQRMTGKPVMVDESGRVR